MEIRWLGRFERNHPAKASAVGVEMEDPQCGLNVVTANLITLWAERSLRCAIDPRIKDVAANISAVF